jgi:hypothetical protein
MIKKLKFLAAAPLIIGMIGFASFTAFATTAPTTAEIDVVVTNNSTITSSVTAPKSVSALTATITDASGNDISTQTGITIDNSSATAGTYKIAGLTKTGDYYVTLTSGNNSEKIKTTVTSMGIKTFQAKWDDATSISASKSGVLGGLVINSGAAVKSAVVEAYNSTGTLWTTKTDTNGEYNFYLVPGKYTLVVNGAAGTNPAENTSASFNVIAGCKTGPMTDSTQQSWSDSTSNKLGYSVTKISSDSKIITGTANNGSTVTAYAYNAGTYTLLGQPVTAAKGVYSITLTNYPVGITVAIRVTDPSLNVYEDDAALASGASTRSMTITAPATAPTIATSAVISYKDTDSTATTQALMNSYLYSHITSITVAAGSGTASTLTSTQYKLTSGTITINGGILSTAGTTYTVTINATGYTPGSITVTTTASKTAAGILTGTFTVVPGSTAGSTEFSVIGTAKTSGDLIVYKVSSSATTAEFLDNVFSGSLTDNLLVAKTDISGVDPTTNKYIDIDEVTSTGMIVSTKRVILSAAQITLVIDKAAIAGVTAPAKGATPVKTVTATTEYTATVTWSPAAATTFAQGTAYTATITITPKVGYILTGVPANFFTVAGATATNDKDLGVVTAVFPATGITFTAATDTSTSNNAATLGLTGTKVTSDTTSVATVAITSGKIAIKSVKAGSATITVTDASSDTATIAVSVAANGAITIGTITPYAAAPTFTAATDSTTANTTDILGLVGTSATSGDNTIAKAAISSDNSTIDITSVKAGSTTITVSDGTNTATIAVSVAADGTIKIGTITPYTTAG